MRGGGGGAGAGRPALPLATGGLAGFRLCGKRVQVVGARRLFVCAFSSEVVV